MLICDQILSNGKDKTQTHVIAVYGEHSTAT